MDFGRVVEINDGVTNHLIFQYVEINGVIGAQSCRTTVDLHHLGKTVADLQPVADFVRAINLNRYAADDAGEEILPSEAQDDCDYSRTRQQPFQLRFGVIAVAQNE